MTVLIKPQYIHLVQKPGCCNVTCLQMILYRNGFGLFDQEALAKYFDVKVGKKDRAAFNVRLGTYTRVNHDEGLQTIESEEIVNKFFKDMRIPLMARAVRASGSTYLDKFLENHLLLNHDLWVEYKAHRIHKNDIAQGRYIHDGLIEKIDNKGQVVLIDPYGGHKPRIKVSTRILAESISSKFGRETGFIVISKT